MRLLPILASLSIPIFLSLPGLAEPPSTESDETLATAIRHLHAQELEAAEARLLSAREALGDPAEPTQGAEIAHYLGRVYLAQGDSKRALAELEQAIRLDPSSSESQFWLAETLVERIEEVPFFFKLGIAKRMRDAYEKAVALDPENLEARVSVARFHSEAPAMAGGNPERATLELEEIGRRDPALAHVTRGLIHERLGRAEAAEEALRAAIDVDPGSALAWRELGLYLQRQERWQEAQKAFAEVLVCAPEDPVALYESARSAMAIADLQMRRAEEALLAHLQLEPGPGPMVFGSEAPSHQAVHRQLQQVYQRQGRSDLELPALPWRP